MTEKNKNIISVAICATVGVGLVYFAMKYRRNILKRIQLKNLYTKKPEILIVNNIQECTKVVKKLKLHCADYNVLGFDCEWVQVNGTRRPVALLQLASHTGLCALIRLCHLKTIPPELRELLEDTEVVKVGVAPYSDAIYLAKDYGVCVSSTLDLRHLASLTCNVKPEGLASLSQNLLNIELNKNWRVRCSDWNAHTLTENQITYAAYDAYVGIEIFKKLFKKITEINFFTSKRKEKEMLEKFIENYDYLFDNTFTFKQTNETKKISIKKINNKNVYRNVGIRSKPLYDNCYMEAPDGVLLCTCDSKKANWYINNNLASKIKDDPFTIRLNFEPSSRGNGESRRYYLQEKQNRCVVCGQNESYLKKNIVPREYRKLFPDIMKDHSSHDVLLLCVKCHQKSNMSDLIIRNQLAKLCNAPFADKNFCKFKEIPELKNIRSAARALLMSKNKIPDARKEELKNVIREAHPNCEFTPEFLNELSEMETKVCSDNYQVHGKKVVDYFKENDGLVELEKMWRKHFINTMKPKYLPEYWSIDHNVQRLQVKAVEGKLSNEDMIKAGMDQINKKILEESQPEILHKTDEYNSDDTNSLLSQPSDTKETDTSSEEEFEEDKENFSFC